MISCLNIISLPVLNLASGKQIGIVKNVQIKNLKLTNLVAFNNESEFEEEFVVPCKNVYKFGDSAITLKSETGISASDVLHGDMRILGSTIYNQKGEKKGTATDVLFNDKTLKVELIKTKNTSIKAAEISTIENGIILLKGGAKIIKSKMPLNIMQTKNISDINVKILNGDIKVNKTSILGETKNENKEKEEIKAPQKISINQSFLIGRIMRQNLVHPSGKTIIKSGEVITENNLEKAVKSGYLKFLIKNSMPL